MSATPGARLAGACVFVTGAGGFVGPHLARELVRRGARVHGFGLGAPPASAPVERWTEADLGDAAALAEALAVARPAAIVHLAGQSSAARSFEAPQQTFQANVVGTRRLLEAAEATSPAARVLVVSTSEVYGPHAPGMRADEDVPLAPVSPYGSSKAESEAVAAAFAESHGLDVVRVRPFGHTGPGQTARFVIPAWAEQVAAIERGGREPVLRVGNLEVTRDLSDVRDIVRGYAELIERGARGAVYNLCRGEGVRLADVVQQLAAMARVPVRVDVDPALLRPADVPYLVGDPSRVHAATGWRAEIPFERTLADVLEEWRTR
ncbi:MAG TPA: GDP-mannose 4,6-dehydratase [Candidatus Acidoferrales bacterium]|nr:GDP-mannose 4,6-dehydratase [Candidatus Acidoferrales bacterium]